MHKAKEMIGLPVLDLKTGQELGVVRDVLFNEEWMISGLFVETKTLFRRGRYIPYDSIYAFGEDCITVPEQESLLLITENLSLNGVKTGPKSLVGKPLYTTNGQCLGQVEDIYFGEEFGEITGYEVSDGFLSDLLVGRKSLQQVESCTIGDDAVVIKDPNKGEETS